MGTLSSGVYRIFTGTAGPEAQYLTASEEGVTVAPKGAAPEREQEFSVEVREDGLAAIQSPARLFPSRSLSYREPEKGERVVLGRLSDFPTREWKITEGSKPGTFTIAVAGDEQSLVVALSSRSIFPPQLELAPSDEEGWTFELVQA
ncbi:hypothetical protein ACF1E9_31795 [Streptomyces roseolus]|uniref:hypothetical protein n=1 Tax=Streptomyces roseolus TaxID=67358 RepID=UPI0036FA4277